MVLSGLLKLPRITKRGVAVIAAIYALIVGSAQISLVFQMMFTTFLLAYDRCIPPLRYVDYNNIIICPKST